MKFTGCHVERISGGHICGVIGIIPPRKPASWLAWTVDLTNHLVFINLPGKPSAKIIHQVQDVIITAICQALSPKVPN